MLRERLRIAAGRALQPGAGVIDSQPVKTAGVGAVRGYDAAMNLSGRTRRVPVETHGLAAQVCALVLPRRWVIEQTFSWFGQNSRRGKDYERLRETNECLIYAAMIRLMARRLAGL